MGDSTVIVAALAGAVAGLLLLRMANARDARTDRDRTPPPPGPPTPTRYARLPIHSAAPILFAVGLALFGVGLAMGSRGGTWDGAWDILLLGPGLVVLLTALAATLRRDSGAGQPQGQAPDDEPRPRDSDGVQAPAISQPPDPDGDPSA